MNPFEIAEVLAVVVLSLIALVALGQIVDWSRCLGYLKTRRKERREKGLHHLQTPDDSCS